jgi:16S rRNA (uracil1498-N3)-methyltransferase
MDVYRFYVPDLQLQVQRGGAGAVMELPVDQAHHARGVLRLEAGAAIMVFDGAGAWANGKIVRVGKQGVETALTGQVTIDPRPAPTLTLATAVPKGERAEWLIEQASQLNVTAVQWLVCQRGVVKPREGGGKMDKWRRLAVESAKQCGRNHLLEVREPVEVGEILGRALALMSRTLWLDPGPGGVGVVGALGDWRGAVTALIGPEGGWSPAERQALEAAAAAGRLRRVRLTETVLRIETACAAVAGVVMTASDK